MTAFAYTAINAQGLVSKGVLHASDSDAAKDQLRQQGLLAQSLAEQKVASSGGARFAKIKPKSLQIFSRQFATLIQAGVSIVQALLILEEQTDDKKLSSVIAEVREDVESGVVLSRAMARHPKVFSRLFVAMIEAGEASGTLDIVLDRVAIQIEKETKLKRRVKSAMLYPTVVLTFATLVLIGMLMFLVPIFKNIFAQLGGQLPALTQYVVHASNLLKGAPWVLLFIPLGIWGFFRWKRTERGRRIWDTAKLRFPMKIGDTVRKITMARFSRTLSTLVAAGVDIIRALEITGQACGNYVVEEALIDVRNRVREGASIAQPLVDNPVFPPMVSQMIRIGEETGELDKMLAKIADFYEDEVDASIGALTSIVEPLMMIGVGVMVGVIVIAMYMPMFKMLQLVH